MSNKDFFHSIEQKTGVNKQELFKLVDSVKNANFQDEAQVRQVIKAVSMLAGKPVTKEKEEFLVKAILNKQIPNDISKYLGR